MYNAIFTDHLSLLVNDLVFSERLTLKYGFENQPYGYCHDFLLYKSGKKLIVKDSNGTEILNYDYNPTNPIVFSKTDYLNASVFENKLRLCFRNLSRIDMGNYFLEDVNSGRQTNFFIDVDYESKIRKFIGETNIKENSSVRFLCDVESKPLSNITWLLPHNGIDDRGQQDGNNSTFSISNSTCEHTGEYICSASNRKNKVDKKGLFLNVTCAPKFENGQRHHEIKLDLSIGYIIEYGINFTSNPSSKIITETTLNVSSISVDEVHYTLFIQKCILDEKDLKNYTIDIRNKLGVAQLTLYTIQQKKKIQNASDMKMEWRFITILSVSTILVSVSGCVVYGFKAKKKKKTKKVVYNDQRKPVPTPRRSKRNFETVL